jgi:hypothetical protein
VVKVVSLLKQLDAAAVAAAWLVHAPSSTLPLRTRRQELPCVPGVMKVTISPAMLSLMLTVEAPVIHCALAVPPSAATEFTTSERSVPMRLRTATFLRAVPGADQPMRLLRKRRGRLPSRGQRQHESQCAQFRHRRFFSPDRCCHRRLCANNSAATKTGEIGQTVAFPPLADQPL